MTEAWRKVPGHPCEQEYWSGATRTTVRGLPYVLRHGRDPKGYPQVSVGGKTVRVHRLQALAWLPEPKRGKTQVRHLDGDKENLAAWNLAWGDGKDQHKDKVHAGTSRAKRVRLRNGSENRGKERNRTGAYRARVSRTSGT